MGKQAFAILTCVAAIVAVSGCTDNISIAEESGVNVMDGHGQAFMPGDTETGAVKLLMTSASGYAKQGGTVEGIRIGMVPQDEAGNPVMPNGTVSARFWGPSDDKPLQGWKNMRLGTGNYTDGALWVNLPFISAQPFGEGELGRVELNFTSGQTMMRATLLDVPLWQI